MMSLDKVSQRKLEDIHNAKCSAMHSVHVGVLHSHTGTMSSSEIPVVRATLLAVEEINSMGGLLNARLLPQVLDGESDRRKFAEQARRLIYDFHAKVIFGCWTSSCRKAVKKVIEAEDSDCLLFYPVQYEGLEISKKIIYTGALPNQQIYPALEYCVSHLTGDNEQCRFFIVGSDYLFPRVATELIKNWVDMHERSSIVGEPVLLPFQSQDEDVTDGGITSVVRQITDEMPAVILNLINGNLNRAFLKALRDNAATSDIPVVAFSLTEAELCGYDPAWMKHLYASWSYFDPGGEYPKPSFAKRFREGFNSPYAVTSDPMWNAYAGVKLWANAVENAKSFDVAGILETLHVLPEDKGTISDEGDQLKIDPNTRHAFKMFKIGKIDEEHSRSGMPRFELNGVGSTLLHPEIYPTYGDPDEWDRYVEMLWFVENMAVGDHEEWDRPRRFLLKEITAPRVEKNPWLKLSEKPGYLNDTADCLRVFKDPHNIQDLLALSGNVAIKKAVEALAKVRSVRCTDRDVVEIFESTRDLDPSLAVAKSKAFFYRGRDKAYLFDILHFAMVNLGHAVILDGRLVKSLVELKPLIHENYYFPIDLGRVRQVLESFGEWRRKDGENAWEGVLMHHVEKHESEVHYRLMAEGVVRPTPIQLDRLLWRENNKGNMGQFLSAMRYLFQNSAEDEDRLTLVVSKFDSGRWLKDKRTGLFLFVWRDEPLESPDASYKYGLAMAGYKRL